MSLIKNTYFQSGLYSSQYEKDSCGVGFVANSKGHRSHEIVSQAITALKNMSHRGAQGSDPTTGDGAGILVQIPYDFFSRVCEQVKQYSAYGVGMIFLPREPRNQQGYKEAFEAITQDRGLEVLGWRQVPVNSEAIGESARTTEPDIWQVFIKRTHPLDDESFERHLYLLRKIADKKLRSYPSFLDPQTGKASTQFYISSLSCRTLLYKGLLLPSQLDQYYLDLNDPNFVSAVALVHSRFSTNTFPAWELAHPYRFICHNGEINTIQGNVHWMRARQGKLSSANFGNDIKHLFPIIDEGQSDSACLDNAVEFLVHGGRSLPHSMMMLIPEPWVANPRMDMNRRGFYEYHSAMMEPWDGPAAVCFTDGRYVGATLDRNGLRPCRYQILEDHTVIVASETGVVPVSPKVVVEKGRLQPGRMFLIDLKEGRIISDEEIKSEIASKKPYRSWVIQDRITLDELPEPLNIPQPTHEAIVQLQRTFGYTEEEVNRVILPMAIQGEEPTSSMGNDTPLAILSEHPQLLFKYFRQLFAQVTNPPIDPIREHFVMSLSASIGPRPNLLLEEPGHCRRIKVNQPILSNSDLKKIRELKDPSMRSITLKILFNTQLGSKGFRSALSQLCRKASAAVREGYRFIILSDRGSNSTWAALPSLLALSAVHQRLIRKSQRAEVGLIVETAEARDVHQLACLFGYGAGTVNPYLVFESLIDYHQNGLLPLEIDATTACEKYIKALNKGLLKIMSKMGISTIQSYCGAQIFEAIGLKSKLVNRYFQGTASRLGGLDLDGIAQETLDRHQSAFAISNRITELEPGGDIHFRTQGETHFWNPETISKLQWATQNKDPLSYQQFSEQVKKDNCFTLRGLLELQSPLPEISLSEVEPASSIVKRFTTGAMSFGALSKEAHETLALAMNRIGAKSNSGEGGEDSERFSPWDSQNSLTSKSSAIKQVASARFGVTTHYLLQAKEIQIKMAQGAKPGEGGQLPGYKVDEIIAKLRYSTPGVQLISPPPHHDIYSIEDLAQLIYDLKNVNPKAEISVKLVAEVGVGTVAAGVAKAHADKILISGDSGGTGASPLSSIKYVGIPWEMGLAETHQTLVLNGLRDRVRLETDGQLKTGRDVLTAALLGAEEYGFSTAPLIVEGCIMMRKCHLNTCPVGVATQDPELRKKFTGQPEHVINYFFFVAEEVRQLMAQLGIRTMQQLIGRSDFLRPLNDFEVSTQDKAKRWKAQTLDLSLLLHRAQTLNQPPQLPSQKKEALDPFNLQLVKQCKTAMEQGTPFKLKLAVGNTHRCVGTLLSSQVVQRWGPQGLPAHTLDIHLCGSAGQSFGAFLAPGITLRLQGEANDYVGKGLSGGKILVFPFQNSKASAHSILVGNTCLYGATSGEVFLAGIAGERFAVRNSGALAVVEGVGDHGCEYMTGGMVVVIGPTGQNFAAGMSGGISFIFDEDELFESRCNLAMVQLETLSLPEDRSFLYNIIKKHQELTGSLKAQFILNHWLDLSRCFKKVIPTEFKRVLAERKFPVPELQAQLTI